MTVRGYMAHGHCSRQLPDMAISFWGSVTFYGLFPVPLCRARSRLGNTPSLPSRHLRYCHILMAGVTHAPLQPVPPQTCVW